MLILIFEKIGKLKLKISSTGNGQLNYIQTCEISCINRTSTTLNITCCQYDSCNAANIKQVVSSCYVSGIFSNQPSTIPGYQSCISPQNQYCGRMTSLDGSLNNYLCMDSCTNGIKAGLNYSCCNNTYNCNPDFSCIYTYGGVNVLTPDSTNCVFEEYCQVKVYFIH